MGIRSDPEAISPAPVTSVRVLMESEQRPDEPDGDIVVCDARADRDRERRQFSIHGRRVVVVPAERVEPDVAIHVCEDDHDQSLHRAVEAISQAVVYDAHLDAYFDVVVRTAADDALPSLQARREALANTANTLAVELDPAAFQVVFDDGTGHA